LLRQRKDKQKKGEPKAVPPAGYLALLASPGVVRKLARLRQAPALIRSPLRCSARPMAAGARVCSFAALTLHTLAVTQRATRALLPQPRQHNLR